MELKRAAEEAATIIKQGGVAIFPTDTLWAIGCDATNPQAVERLKKLIGTPHHQGVVTIAKDMNMVARFVKEVPEIAEQLHEVSDTPLTIVYSKASGVAPGVAAQDGSIAIRVCESPFCNILLTKLGRLAVAAALPSNFNGTVDYTAPQTLDEGSTGKLSSIIYIGDGGIVKIIRK